MVIFFNVWKVNVFTLKSLLVELMNKHPCHQDIKLFETKEIEYPSFPDWSMKYISKRSQIQQFCREMGLMDFNPFAFQQSHVDALLMQLCIEQGEEQNQPKEKA